jgi:hypothetical protein
MPSIAGLCMWTIFRGREENLNDNDGDKRQYRTFAENGQDAIRQAGIIQHEWVGKPLIATTCMQRPTKKSPNIVFGIGTGLSAY